MGGLLIRYSLIKPKMFILNMYKLFISILREAPEMKHLKSLMQFLSKIVFESYMFNHIKLMTGTYFVFHYLISNILMISPRSRSRSRSRSKDRRSRSRSNSRSRSRSRGRSRSRSSGRSRSRNSDKRTKSRSRSRSNVKENGNSGSRN